MPRHLGPSLILLATLVATLWLGPSVVRRAAWSHTETQLTTVRDSLATDTDLTLLSNAFERVAQVVEPSVVHIQVFHRKTPGGNWFNRYDPAAPSGNGSGWIYRHFSSNNNNADYEDVILTNHHVVDGAGRIVVRLADGREHDATLLASDQATDMAVLRLPTAGPLHAAALSLNPVAKGQIVFAFGSPLAFDFSVSQGIVSASGRQLSLDSSGRYESYIQTDAAINPGNSGGPLTDIHGRVVGMNFAIASDPGPDSPHNSPHTLRPSTPSRGFLGLGFAIPVNIAVQVADQMIADGQVNRGYLAVYIADLAPNMAKALGHPANTQGVLISHPLTHGPGHAAGLLPGDIVTAVANQPVTTAGELRYRVSTFPPGASINLNVLRPSTPQPFQLTATLDTLPKEVPRHRVPQPDFTS
ncbi:MAG: trypsin-like peptidase domain-containing protein, partial [Algisphaera sp.]